MPLPGTSAQHRQSKQMRRATHAAQRSSITDNSSPLPFRSPPGTEASQNKRSPSNAASADLNEVDPFALFTDEVKNSYLRCSYKWSFHHIPTLLQQVREKELDIWVIWAVLALSIRFVNVPPAPYSTPIEASNAYAAHARQLLQSSIEEPSLSRLQALLMIVGHSWGAGDGARAWMYLGTAVRMVQMMGLCEEQPLPANRAPTTKEFIHAEEKRRAAWTCFLMDSLLSGGKGRKRSLTFEDMHIQLPCEKDFFYFGEPVNCERLDGRILPNPLLPVAPLGIVAHSMRAADFWGDVARWACSSIVREELPWAPDSQYQRLLRRIEHWKSSLPHRLQYSLFSLHAHSATDNGQAYIYMWAVYDMAKMFLHRAYLPVLGLNHDQDLSQSTIRQESQATPSEWNYWRQHSRKELFATAASVCDMMEEMRKFGVFFLRGCVPWIGFTIYTAVGVMLYSYNFPASDDDADVVSRAKDRVIDGCSFLKEMKAWPMADTWFETIKRMQAFYRNLKTKGDEGVTPDERENLKNALVDYGHLQSPPAEPTPSSNASPAAAQVEKVEKASSSSPAGSIIPATPANLVSDGDSVPSPLTTQMPTMDANGFATDMTVWDQELTNPFEYNYDFNSADLDAIMADATQGFWVDFPGEVGFS